jgi:hypothetical protein
LGSLLDTVIEAKEGVMQRYSAEIQRRMRVLFRTLSEKDRRRYAAVEACKLGHGGTR